MARARVPRAEGFDPEAMFGLKPVSIAQANKGFAAAGDQWKRRMATRWEAERQFASVHAPITAALLASLEGNPAVAKVAPRMAALHAKRASKRRSLPPNPNPIPTPRPTPQPPPPRPQPISANLVPPYSLDSHWLTTHGVTPSTATSGDKTTGKITVDLNTANSNPSSPSSAAGTGFVGFRLPTVPFASATCQVWTSPSLSYDYLSASVLAGASCSAFIGLAAYAYNLDGAPAGQVVDQQPSLFNVSTWITNASDVVSESAHNLYCSFGVDNNHSYTVLIQCGAVVTGQGWGPLSGSGADVLINVFAPSFTWQLS